MPKKATTAVPPPRAALQDAGQRINQSPVKEPGVAEKAAGSVQASKASQDKLDALTAVLESMQGPVGTNSATGFLQRMHDRSAAADETKKTSATKSASATGGKKRKTETTLEEDIAAYKQDLSDVEVDGLYVDKNCNQVRKLINQVLDNNIMKKGEFCNAIGSSNQSLNTFLGKSGPQNGIQSEAYTNAWAWFKQREVAGLKMPDVKKRQKAEAAASDAASGSAAGPAAKKAKTSAAAEAVPDLSQIHLDGEEDDEVPVFDTADELRKKISAHLKTPGLTQAQFCRDLYARYNKPTCKTISTTQLSSFRGKKGPRAEITSSVFYAAYVYFEKLRLATKKPKSTHRVQMESIYPRTGIDQDDDGRCGYICSASETVHMDQFGQVRISGSGRF